MKKAILVVAALLMVVSGIAAVSAYEAHIINVTAHVENALTVDTAKIEFGTVFPQEWLIKDRVIALSTSANAILGEAEGDLLDVDYTVWAEYKLETAGDPPEYYFWMGEWLWVGIDAADPVTDLTGWNQVGSQPDGTFDPLADPWVAPDPMAVATSSTGTLNAGNKEDTLRVMLLAPCFHGDYNEDTDVKPAWWPTPGEPDWPLLPQGLLGDPGVDMGLDLKIQVTDIGRQPAPK